MKEPQCKAWLFIAALLGAIFTSSVAAQDGTSRILAPWESEGQLFQISPNQLLIQGSANGIMYLEGEDETGQLDGAPFICPTRNLIDLEKKTSEVSGHCIVSPGAGDGVVFAEFTCEGQLGTCEGKLKITGGTDQYEDASGSGKMIVRTAVVDLLADPATATVIRDAQGLAIWPELKYKLPTKKTQPQEKTEEKQ
ncbi:MAG: hypothetical protein WAN46_19435 [Gammaproteobacteria bacterium]